MRIDNIGIAALTLAAVVLAASAGPAHAYIDPGVGGMLLQLLLGGVAGALVVIKLYWHRLKGAVAKMLGRQPPESKPHQD
jgi:hypothetical protein